MCFRCLLLTLSLTSRVASTYSATLSCSQFTPINSRYIFLVQITPASAQNTFKCFIVVRPPPSIDTNSFQVGIIYPAAPEEYNTTRIPLEYRLSGKGSRLDIRTIPENGIFATLPESHDQCFASHNSPFDNLSSVISCTPLTVVTSRILPARSYGIFGR